MHAQKKPACRPDITTIKAVRLAATPHMYRQGVTPLPLDSCQLREVLLKEIREGRYTPENGYSPCQCSELLELANAYNGSGHQWMAYLSRYSETVRRKLEIGAEEAHDLVELDFGRLLAWVCRRVFFQETWVREAFSPLKLG